MAYPEKKKYPYGWSTLQLRLNGRMIQGSKKPASGYFSGSGEKVYFNGYFNHERNDEKFSAALSIPGFSELLTVVEEMAKTPYVVGEQNEKIVNRQALMFFKSGQFNHSGTELGLVRNEEGLLYLLVKNKNIPSIPFEFLPQGDYGWIGADGNPPPVHVQSRRKALTWVQNMRELLAVHIESEATSNNTAAAPAPAPSQYDGGSNTSVSGGFGGNAPSASNSYDEFTNF